MPVINLLVYLSSELIQDDSLSYITYVRDALSLGAKRTCHYQAIPDAFKDVEPHLVFCSFALSEDARSSPRDLTGMQSLPPAPKSLTSTSQPGLSSSLPSLEEPGNAKPNSSSPEIPPDADLRRSSSISDFARQVSSHLRLIDGGLPQLNQEEIIWWSDDDVDATDFKNMPDYDPHQEESVYDSTPSLESKSVSPMKVEKCLSINAVSLQDVVGKRRI